jgi:hypothetical protein
MRNIFFPVHHYIAMLQETLEIVTSMSNRHASSAARRVSICAAHRARKLPGSHAKLQRHQCVTPGGFQVTIQLRSLGEKRNNK